MLLNSFNKKVLECGTDEAGRGCQAGPVTAAAVILPKPFRNLLLNDSKLVYADNRMELKNILQKSSMFFSGPYE